MTAYRFFYKHSGFSYNPKIETREQGRRRCARELAAAEAHAQHMGWTVTWEWDDYVDHGNLGCDRTDEHEHEVLMAVLMDRRGAVLGSLGGIELSGPGDTYRRVVEAELALEARAEIGAALMEAI